MNVLLFLIQLFPLLILFLSFYKIEYSILLFICYNVLVPLDGFTLGSIHLGNNFLFLILFISFAFRYKLSKLDLFSPFFFLYFTLFIFIFFEHRMSIGEQLNRYRQELMSVFILPIIIYISYLKGGLKLSSLKKAILLSAIISSVYAFLLSFLPYGLNPYLIYLEQNTEFVYMINYSNDINRGIARIFSTMANPQSWALYLGFILYFTLFFIKNKALKIFLIILIGYNILFCGVRTVIVAVTLPLFYYALKTLKVKYFIYIFLGIIAVGWLTSINDGLHDYFLSFINDKRSSTAGSDMEMRLYQLEGVCDEIKQNPLFGNGFRWTAYYNENFGNHPKAFTFESLFFVILSCWGYAGIIIWGVFILFLIRKIQSFPENMRLPLNILLIYYIIFSMVTGEYLYIVRFTLYYTIFYIFLLHKKKNAHVIN